MHLLVAGILGMLSFAETPALEYRLGPGDVINLQVFDEPDLTRKSRISATCRVDVGLIGAVQVCGRPPHEVAAEIRDRLADGWLNQPQVIVDVETYGSQRVEVRGAVKKRGIQVLEGPTTLSEVVTSAGGPDGDNVVEVDLIRPDGEVVSYQISQLHTTPVLVEGGDVVVLRQGRHVFVDGQVQRVGPVPFTEGLRVTQALGLAQGPNEFGALRRAYVVRASGERIHVNIRRIQEGREADVVLEPEDRLVIPRSIF